MQSNDEEHQNGDGRTLQSQFQDLADLQCYISHNYLNLVCYMTNLATCFCVGWMGWGRDVNGDFEYMSNKYQTLLTPIYWTNAIWVLIFSFETVFIGVHMGEKYRQLSIIQKGFKLWFACASCASIGWIVSFCLDAIYASLIFQCFETFFLIGLCYSLYYTKWEETIDPIVEFMIFRFPFQLHLGWAIFTLMLNISQMALDFQLDGIYDYIAYGGIVYLLAVGLFSLFFPEHPSCIIPLVLAWGSLGIFIQLNKSGPSYENDPSSDTSTYERIKFGALASFIGNLVVTIVRFTYYFIKNFYIVPRHKERNGISNAT